MVCLYVEGNAFFQNYFDTSYVCLFSFQASANKRQQSATDFPVIAYCTKKLIMHLVICSCDLGFSTWQHAILLS
jgi:hypothetical protein